MPLGLSAPAREPRPGRTARRAGVGLDHRRRSASCGASSGPTRAAGRARRSWASLIAGVVLLVAFVVWERRAREPMLPMRLFRNRAFAAANAASLLMFFGMFGSIFLLTQYLQNVQGYSPLEAGCGCCRGRACR